MHELTKLIREDMKPALGVTEPGAIAFAAAKARSCVPGEVESVAVSMNSGRGTGLALINVQRHVQKCFHLRHPRH